MRRVAGSLAALAAVATLAVPAAAPAQSKQSAGPAGTVVRGDPDTALSDAILRARPGDTLRLGPGEYLMTEGTVLEAKDLTIVGAGEDLTTVVPSGGGDAFDDPGVTVEDLTVGEPLSPASEGDEAGGDGIETRAQIIAVIATFIVFLFVLELVRRRRLVERYALLWMLAALALLVLAIWTELLERIADLMGIAEPANAIFLLAFAVAFLLLLNFSVVTSRLGDETKILAQEVARLDQELRAEQAENRTPVEDEDPAERG